MPGHSAPSAQSNNAGPLLSFSEFVGLRRLAPLRRGGFEGHIRERGLTFDFRTANEWDDLLNEYLTADRRRRR